MVMVYESSSLINEEWVTSEEAEIGLLETLNYELVCDVWEFAYLKFLRDLFHTTPSDIIMGQMLGRLESVYLDETVEERVATVEEQLERETIYGNHLESQAVLVAATTAAAAAAAAVAGFNVAAGSIGA
jgi:hypothetical protein